MTDKFKNIIKTIALMLAFALAIIITVLICEALKPAPIEAPLPSDTVQQMMDNLNSLETQIQDMKDALQALPEDTLINEANQLLEENS